MLSFKQYLREAVTNIPGRGNVFTPSSPSSGSPIRIPGVPSAVLAASSNLTAVYARNRREKAQVKATAPNRGAEKLLKDPRIGTGSSILTGLSNSLNNMISRWNDRNNIDNDRYASTIDQAGTALANPTLMPGRTLPRLATSLLRTIGGVGLPAQAAANVATRGDILNPTKFRKEISNQASGVGSSGMRFAKAWGTAEAAGRLLPKAREDAATTNLAKVASDEATRPPAPETADVARERLRGAFGGTQTPSAPSVGRSARIGSEYIKRGIINPDLLENRKP